MVNLMRAKFMIKMYNKLIEVEYLIIFWPELIIIFG